MLRVTAAILMKNDKVLIARRRADDKQAGKWEFPGGKIEGNETPQECLRREMREEFGVDVAVGKFFGESSYDYESESIQLLAYYTVWKGGEFSLNAHADYRWVALTELQNFDFTQADINFVEKLQKEI